MITVKKKFAKKVILIMFITIICFAGVVCFYNWHGREVQTELIIGFFSIFGGEFGALAWIKTKKCQNENNQ